MLFLFIINIFHAIAMQFQCVRFYFPYCTRNTKQNGSKQQNNYLSWRISIMTEARYKKIINLHTIAHTPLTLISSFCI